MRQLGIDREQALMEERAAQGNQESMSPSLLSRSPPTLRQASPHTSRRQSPYPAKKHEVPITSRGSTTIVTPPFPAASAKQIEAASKIQAFYRSRLTRRMALSTISSISSKFNTLVSSFHPPNEIDYRTEGGDALGVVSIPVHYPFEQFDGSSMTSTSQSIPKLAYTTTNKPIHAYIEDLNRLLSALDAIESGGDGLVRGKRKQLAQAVESEAQRLDRWISGVWEAAQGLHM